MEIDLSSVQRVQDRVKSWTSSKTRNIKQSETRESPSSSWKQLYRKRRAPSHDGDASTTHTAWNVDLASIDTLPSTSSVVMSPLALDYFTLLLDSPRLHSYIYSHPHLFPHLINTSECNRTGVTSKTVQMAEGIGLDSSRTASSAHASATTIDDADEYVDEHFVQLEDDDDGDEDDPSERTPAPSSSPLHISSHALTFPPSETHAFPTSHTSDVPGASTLSCESSYSPIDISTMGKAVVVRKEGATVRNAIPVDGSDIVDKLVFGEEVFFDELATLEAPYLETHELVDVTRLHVYVRRNGSVVSGWASLAGRTVVDHLPLLRILQPIPSCPSYGNNSPVAKEAQGSAGKELDRLSVCPFCQEHLPISMSAQQKQDHIADCIGF